MIGTFVFNININVSIFLTLIPILIGVAFGCNYNEDLSLIRYFKLLISKPAKEYYSKPVEDLEQLHNAAARIREEEELRKRQQEKMSDEAQRKLLIKMGVGALIAIVLLVAVLVVIKVTKTEEIHHTVQTMYDVDDRSEIV